MSCVSLSIKKKEIIYIIVIIYIYIIQQYILDVEDIQYIYVSMITEKVKQNKEQTGHNVEVKREVKEVI